MTFPVCAFLLPIPLWGIRPASTSAPRTKEKSSSIQSIPSTFPTFTKTTNLLKINAYFERSSLDLDLLLRVSNRFSLLRDRLLDFLRFGLQKPASSYYPCSQVQQRKISKVTKKHLRCAGSFWASTPIIRLSYFPSMLRFFLTAVFDT